MTPSILPVWRAMPANPRRIGTITPASRALCDALADEVESGTATVWLRAPRP